MFLHKLFPPAVQVHVKQVTFDDSHVSFGSGGARDQRAPVEGPAGFLNLLCFRWLHVNGFEVKRRKCLRNVFGLGQTTVASEFPSVQVCERKRQSFDREL